VKVAASTGWEILKKAGVDPAPAADRAGLVAVPAIPGRGDPGVRLLVAFDAVLAGAGIRTVLGNIRTPRMNAIAER
jgi:hypothetical protein